jgi:hypothetical protein
MIWVLIIALVVVIGNTLLVLWSMPVAAQDDGPDGRDRKTDKGGDGGMPYAYGGGDDGGGD